MRPVSKGYDADSRATRPQRTVVSSIYSDPLLILLEMGQRALKLMGLAFVAGKFAVTAPLVAARIRQCILRLVLM